MRNFVQDNFHNFGAGASVGSACAFKGVIECLARQKM